MLTQRAVHQAHCLRVKQAMAHCRHGVEFLLEVFLNTQSDKVVPSTKYGKEYKHKDWCVSRVKVANKAVTQNLSAYEVYVANKLHTTA